MTSRVCSLLICVLLAGCGEPRLLSEKLENKYAPETQYRIFSFKKIPVAAQTAFLDSLNHFNAVELSKMTVEHQTRVKARAALGVFLADRHDHWVPGLGNEHFLEAGKTPTGYWILYEHGGVVPGKKLRLITVTHDGIKIGATIEAN